MMVMAVIGTASEFADLAEIFRNFLEHVVGRRLHDHRHAGADHRAHHLFRHDAEGRVEQKFHIDLEVEIDPRPLLLHRRDQHIRRHLPFEKVLFRHGECLVLRQGAPGDFSSHRELANHLVAHLPGIDRGRRLGNIDEDFVLLLDVEDHVERVVLRIGHTEVPAIGFVLVERLDFAAEGVEGENSRLVGKIVNRIVEVSVKYPLALAFACGGHFQHIVVSGSCVSVSPREQSHILWLEKWSDDRRET